MWVWLNFFEGRIHDEIAVAATVTVTPTEAPITKFFSRGLDISVYIRFLEVVRRRARTFVYMCFGMAKKSCTSWIALTAGLGATKLSQGGCLEGRFCC